MNILVTIRTVYGNEMIYPANEAAQVVTLLIGKKTISRSDISNLKKLGHTIEIKHKVTSL
jgi:hypothetical protein